MSSTVATQKICGTPGCDNPARNKWCRDHGVKCHHNKERKTCKECKRTIKACATPGCYNFTLDIWCSNHTLRCHHDKQRSFCVDCGGSGICEHQKRRDRCVDCNGREVCEHKKRRAICKICKGASICEHNRIRSDCRDCEGGARCEHNHMRYTCKQCGGTGICEHNRERSKCRDCGGSSFCEHGKQRNLCKDCGGSSLCIHAREKYSCKECNGNGVCEHNRIRTVCRDCDGSAFCVHSTIKSNCKACGGGSICAHNKRRSYCRECQGGGICVHNRFRGACRDCTIACLCKGPACSIYDNSQRSRGVIKGLCRRCYRADNPNASELKMRIEILVLAEIERKLPHIQEEASMYIWDCPISCTLKKPDLLCVFQDSKSSLQVEIDEDGSDHEDDDTRVGDIHTSAGTKYHRLIRFNAAATKERPCTFRRKRLSNGDEVFQAIEPEFSYRIDLLCTVVAQAWDETKLGLEPTEDGWKIKLFF